LIPSKCKRKTTKKVDMLTLSSIVSPFSAIKLKNETILFMIKEDQIKFQD